jgi:hypothetical protein
VKYVAAKKDKIKGRELTTTSVYEELIAQSGKLNFLRDVVIHNMGENKIHVIVNGGDEISVYGNEMLSCGDIKVYSIIVVEENSMIRYMGIQ